jgi:hypothetical protein
MIIYPKPDAPIASAQEPIQSIYLFPVMQTWDDYRELFHSDPPQPDPSLRAKYWLDPAYAGMAEDDGEEVTYTVVAYDPRTGAYKVDSNGNPVLTTLTISKWFAGRVNMPQGFANEFPSTAAIGRFKPLPVPIRQLHPDEYIAMSGGLLPQPVVINRRKITVTARDIASKIRALLDELDSKL